MREIDHRVPGRRQRPTGRDRQIGRIRVETTAPPPLPDSMIVNRSYGPLGALAAASRQAWDMTVLQAKMFWRMIAGDVSLKNLSGPLSIAEYAGESASGGIQPFLGFLVLISLSLGFLNLLPVPILDGGQIVFQLGWHGNSSLAGIQERRAGRLLISFHQKK